MKIFPWFLIAVGTAFSSASAAAQSAAPPPASAVLGVMLRDLRAEDAQSLGTKGLQGAFVQAWCRTDRRRRPG